MRTRVVAGLLRHASQQRRQVHHASDPLQPCPCPQIHCIPRPGKRGRRRVVYEAANKFAFHHINAWEAEGDAIVLDTCASDSIDFSKTLDSNPLPMLRDRSAKTTPRRLVMRGGNRRVQEYDMGVKAYTELPAPLQPEVTGRPYSHFFAMVRACYGRADSGVVCQQTHATTYVEHTIQRSCMH